jgi:hypothetical protein
MIILITCLKIEVWVVLPYKKPESERRENTIYNNHVSMVRIRSEHAIGFLKGRFQSLKGLRINIIDEMTHKFATYWVVSCIGLHAFAMKCEADERGVDENSSTNKLDPFVFEGLSSTSEAEVHPFIPPPPTRPHQRQMRATTLAAGKARREHLKAALLRHKQIRMDRHAQRHQQGDSLAEDSD